MLWSHDTCKSDDNCILLLFPQHRLLNPIPSSSSPSLPLQSIPLSNPLRRMTNTTLREIPTIPPAADGDSTEFTVFPAKQIQGKSVTESMSTTSEWTNEKHSLYLKSMEASFVNQLYDSKHILGWNSNEGSFSPSTTSSGQFKVLRGGCWRRINFQRENPQISRNNECHDLNANPWIQRFRSLNKHRSVTSPVIEESVTSTGEVADLGQRKGIISGSATVSGHLHLCKSHMSHQEMLCDDTEMSDQNFVDEEVEGEKESKRSSNSKRLKSLDFDAAGSDQMVPMSKSSASGDVTNKCVSTA